MKSSFPGYFSSSIENLDELWASALIVLDTNVLLNLYRYSDSTKTELLAIIRQLSERIWIPNQVAKEFLSNRLIVIGEQSDLYKSHITSLQDFKRPLESQKKHPFISEKLFVECDAIFEKLKIELESSKKFHDERINSDDIKDELASILDGKVGKGYDKEALEKITIDGESRYNEKIPPGFKDIKKGGDSKLLNDRLLKYGDYIIWLQILEHSKNVQRSVIFVTGDVKEDWWLTFHGKTIAPHPLLVEEFYNVVNQPFHMYPVDIFLERAGQHLQQKTSENSLKEIREIQNLEDEDISILDYALNDIWPSPNDIRAFSNIHPETDATIQIEDNIDYSNALSDDLYNLDALTNSPGTDIGWSGIRRPFLVSKYRLILESIESLKTETSKLRSHRAMLLNPQSSFPEAGQVNRSETIGALTRRILTNRKELANLEREAYKAKLFMKENKPN